MNDTGSTLIAHCGAKKVSREELKQFPVPEATRTHQPLSHYEIVEVLEEALSFRYLKVVRDEYAVSADGMKMFGVMDLNAEFSGGRFSIGLRNSNDKSMRLALTAGMRVMVCDNLAFSGDFTPLLHKHTRNLELIDVISIAVDRIHRGFEPLKEKVQDMKEQVLTEDEVKLIIYQAFMEKSIRGIPKHLMTDIHNNYFHPHHEAFYPRNLWSLSNAFTSAFKKLAPIKQFEVTARLGTYLSGVQENLQQKQELDLNLPRDNQESETKRMASVADFGQYKLPQAVGDTNPHSSSNQINDEAYDTDDVAEDPYEAEVFDEYFDAEEAAETIDEAAEEDEEMMEEYLRKVA